MHFMTQVEWSDEDACFIGSAPPLIGRCCHGDTQAEVREHLSIITEEILAICAEDTRNVQQSTGGKKTKPC